MSKPASGASHDYSAMSDEALMARFREKDEHAAFNEIVRRYHQPAVTIARGRLAQSPDLAEDAVQETFVRVVRHRNRFDCRRSFAIWFYTILRNMCLDFGRRGTRQNRQLRELITIMPEQPEQSPQITGSALTILQSLEAAEREILIQRFVNGLTLKEIGELSGISLEATKKRAQRAMAHLRQIWQRESRHP